ncbi:MAG: sulfite exporter TauE/SafE family protein [Desulfotomaculales bacterium]
MVEKIALLYAAASTVTAAGSGDPGAAAAATPWWIWPLTLFAATVVLGVLAVLAGVGGGVLYVPLVSSFFPFHLDFVRGAGLLVALSGSLAAGPGLLRKNLANLRLTLPLALIASACSIVGAFLGLAAPTWVVQTALGLTIMIIAALFVFSKNTEYPEVKEPDRLARFLKLQGIYREESSGKSVFWQVSRTPQGMLFFILIGILAGMFGLGAGWANVPVLNLLMGAPLKVAVGTSKFLLSITDTSAAWVYLNQGCIIPLIAVPSIIGIMLGSFLGVKIMALTKPSVVRYIVIVMLFFTGVQALLKGLSLQGIKLW